MRQRSVLSSIGLAAIVAAASGLLVLAASPQQTQPSPACQETQDMLQRFGRRVDRPGGGWSYAGGEISDLQKRLDTAKADLQVLQALQPRYPLPQKVSTSDARKATEDATRQVKSSEDVPKLPVALANLLNNNPSTIDMKTSIDDCLRQQQSVIANLTTEVNDKARSINELEDRASALCGAATAQPPKPPATGGGGGGGGTPPAAENNPWEGNWKHAFGTMNLDANLDAATIASEIQTLNGLGPELECDRVPHVYLGEISWTGDGGFDKRPWKGRVIACTHQGGLEGKFSNLQTMTTATASLGPRSGFFHINAASDGKSFKGTFMIWNAQTKTVVQHLPIGWEGAKQ